VQSLRNQILTIPSKQGNSESSDVDSENPQSSDESHEEIPSAHSQNSDVDSETPQSHEEIPSAHSASENEQHEPNSTSDSEPGSDDGAIGGDSFPSSDSPGSDSSDTELTEEEKELYLIETLKEWALSPGVLSYNKLDDLLGRLHHVFKSVPVSYKTLLGVPPDLGVQVMNDHEFWYNGIKSCLDRYKLEEYLEAKGCVTIDINMDGLPIFKNPPMKFWPILGRLVGSHNKPFVIAVYFGSSDPSDLDLYLGDFCLEISQLKDQGYSYNGHVYPFIVRNFILDAPARSLVKCCIGHTGYGACEKCSVVGSYSHGRVNFANIGPDCVQRTDDSYRNQLDHLHHTGRSPLELIGIGMVSQFRLDTMHLVDKGVFGRFLDVLHTWDGPWKLDAHASQEISAVLLELGATRPRDFNRPQRSLDLYSKYKCTELRRLLLYDGLVAFKDRLHPSIYRQYVLLQCSMFILSSSYLLPRYVDVAENFLSIYVDHCKEVYGDHYVSYNIHSLTHFGSECRANGTAVSFSAYVYENELKSMKATLNSGYKPLHQLAIKESRKMKRGEDVILETEENVVQLLHCHTHPCETEPGRQYRAIVVNGTTFKLGDKDSCFVTTYGKIVLLQNIICQGERILLRGLTFLQKSKLYDYPMDSAILGIVKVSNLNETVESFPLESVFGKIWLMEDADCFVAVPLTHTTPLLH